MKYLHTATTVDIPEGVEVKVGSRDVYVKGPLGEVRKAFRHVPVDVSLVEKNGKKQVTVEMWNGRYKQKSCVQTVTALIRNMVNGTTRGFRYKMKLVAAHFPIKCEISGDKKVATFKNFLGGKQDKVVVMKPGCTIRNDAEVKDQIIVDGVDNAAVSLSCALINQCVKTGDKDIRKFLDGIYISEKIMQDEDI